MVGKISIGKSLIGVLNYNENKVKEGHAVCLDAVGYGREANELSFYEKLNRLQRLTALNPKAKTNALHISLNFDPSEKPSDEFLRTIAARYMDKIGFGEQPYLVYRHKDAGHDHIHIMTTNIQSDGKRIDLHNIGMDKSGPATRELEKEFNLIKADEKKQAIAYVLKPLEKADYGKTETKRAVSNIVNAVVRDYAFTSLPELNAVLRQYNVTADAGEKGSRMQKNKGLLYYITDEKGNKKSVGIKASSIYGKPTIKELKKRFVKNTADRKQHQTAVKGKLDRVLNDPAIRTKAELAKALHRQQVNVLFRTNDQGFTYGATFVDNEHKVVFNGSSLGKAYSANALNERFKQDPDKPIQAMARSTRQRNTLAKGRKQTIRLDKDWQAQIKLPRQPKLLKPLLETSPVQQNFFKPQRKKRRRKSRGI